VSVLNVLTVVLTLAGCYFFLAGTVGLLRFPDVLTRLHAVTKADNLGLGLIVAGLALQSGSVLTSLKLAFIWVLVLLAGATSCYLIAHGASKDRDGAAHD
jgi:multicomponent Na+:H+ antiporter subunit G